MGSKWRKAKVALGLNLCVYVPSTSEEASPPLDAAGRFSDVTSFSSSHSPTARSSDSRLAMPTTPTPSSSGLRLSKTGSRSFKVCIALFHLSVAYDSIWFSI